MGHGDSVPAVTRGEFFLAVMGTLIIGGAWVGLLLELRAGR
jgi:hypothetical protein